MTYQQIQGNEINNRGKSEKLGYKTTICRIQPRDKNTGKKNRIHYIFLNRTNPAILKDQYDYFV